MSTRLGILMLAVLALPGIFLAVQGQVAAQPAALRFTDVAPRSSFTYRSNNNFTGRKYFPQPMCGGVAAIDYDGDGLVDLYFTNGAKLPEMKKTDSSFYSCLLRNRGDGKFEDVTVKAGLTGAQMDFSFGVAAGDYDNDGRPDLFICNAGRNTLYHNNGDGSFTDVTEGSGLTKPANTLSVQAAWLDYDHDGLLDLVVSNYTFWTPELDKRCITNGQEFYCNPRVYPSVPHRLYHNLGHGKFADVTERSGLAASPGKGMGIAVADFNADGWDDLFIANDTEPNVLFINRGNGTFSEEGLERGVAYNDNGLPVSSMGCDAKDYNNDGLPDVFYNNLMGQVWALFRNERGESFAYASPESKMLRLSERLSGWSNGFIDYNNDGYKDVYSANGDVDNFMENAPQHDTLFQNIDGNTFRDVSDDLGTDFLKKGFQRGSAFVDLNNDGFMDLVVTSLNERPRIMMNSAGNGNHWLLLDLRGTRSTRDAVGAKVKVTTAAGRTLYNHVSVSVGFMSSSDRRVHFGLGSERALKSIEIQWPSGKKQILENPGVDRIMKIEEPLR